MHRTLLNIHLILAAWLFPIALMFALTGGLYTLSIKSGYTERVESVALAAPLTADLAGLTAAATAALAERGEELPSGSASVRKAGTSFELEWTGVARDVTLRPTSDPARAELIVKDTKPWRHFVQLHKAKGNALARAISVTWAIGLIVILGTGLLMALNVRVYRGRLLGAGAAGIATFLAYVFLG